MRTLIFIMFILATTLFSACDKEIDYNLPQSVPKFSIYGYHSNSWIGNSEIHINKSSSVFDPLGSSQIKDATVLFFENHKLLDTIHYDSISNSYRTFSRISKPGSNYKIQVSRPDLGVAYGEYTYPEEVTIKWAEWDTLTNKVSFAFNDLPGDDFYSVSLIVEDNTGTSTTGLFDKADPDIYFFSNKEFDSLLTYTPNTFENAGYNGFMTDETFEGAEKFIRLQLREVESQLMGKVQNVTVNLNHISRDSYLHLKTLSAYLATKDNPFAEPVKIHSNIVNGFGVVGASVPSFKEAIKK